MVKFDSPFVDDAFFVMRPENVNQVYNSLNKFYEILRYAVDMF